MNTAVATIRTRLPVPAGVNPSLWRVLTEAIFPNAKTTEAIVLAMEYCRQRNLDILKKPVNIVPTWNSQLRREVETVWPAITEAQVTAARTHEWAGLDKPVYGPTVTTTFKGRKKDDRGSWIDASVTVTYPEWCERTVYRMVGGSARAFTERVYWVESYARLGGSTLPNSMWCKRPFDQFAKVAKAAALRAAFPEEDSGPTAEQMEGQDITDVHTIDVTPSQPEREGASGDGGDQPADPPPEGWSPPTPPPEPEHDPLTGEVLEDMAPEALGRAGDEDWREWAQRLIARIRHAKSTDVIDQWMKLNEPMLGVLLGEAPKLHANILRTIGAERVSREKAQSERA